jgi:hypothetical protein
LAQYCVLAGPDPCLEHIMNPYFQACLLLGALPMPEIVNGPNSPRCTSAASESGIQGSQGLGPDPSLTHARDGRGRFAKGSSGNPRGRPRGIPNPRRRVPNLVARPLSAPALSRLLDRKPHLLRPLAEQLLPPPLGTVDPAARLGIDLESLPTAEDCRRVLSTVLAAIGRGEIAPAEGARIARGVRSRLVAIRLLLGLGRRRAPKTRPVRPQMA